VFDNDDVTRLPTRYGGGEEGTRRARAAALLLLALPGTTFVYEGQELGLEEVDLPDEARRDPHLLPHEGRPEGTRRLPRADPLGVDATGLRLHVGNAWLESVPGTLVFERATADETVVCAVNIDAPQIDLPSGELILTSAPIASVELPRNTAAWVRTRA
jgi:alpha-glucosidase